MEVLTHFEGSTIQATVWKSQHPAQAEIYSLLQYHIGDCLPSPAAWSFPLCYHISPENQCDAISHKDGKEVAYTSSSLLMTPNTANLWPYAKQLQDSSSAFCKCIKSVFTLSSPASGETKHQSRETFGRMNYLYLLMGALNLDTNTDFCPLLIEAEFPFLAIEEEKRSWMFTSQPKIGWLYLTLQRQSR